MEHWNQKVSQNRGEKWKKSLIVGRLNAQKNPTNIRLARVKLGKTQGEMANLIGVTYSTYGAIESGSRLVRDDRATKIAEILKLSTTRAFQKAKLEGRYKAKRS